MGARLTGLTHRVAMRLRLVAGSFAVCGSRSGRPVRKLLDTPSYRHCAQSCGLSVVQEGLETMGT
jgi:hypothetical protein